MKKILVVLLILFSFTIVKAEELNITISDVVISDHTDTLDVSLSSFSTNEVTSNVTFNNIGEFVTYDITIINNDENKYFIREIKDNNVNQNIEITYDFSDDYIESNETSVIKMTLTYKNQLKNVDSINLDDISISIVFDDGTVVINPGTLDNITFYISMIILSLVILLLVFKYKKKANIMLLLLVLLLLLPISVLGKEVYNLRFTVKNVIVTGEYDMFNIEINPNNDDSNTSVEIRYGDPLGALTEPHKDGYTFEGWFDNNGNPVDEDTVITSEITITARYNPIEYEITYNLDGGNTTNVNKYTIEDEVVLSNPTKNGYNFLGWYTNDTFEGDPVTKIDLGSTGPKEFFAKWEVINYTITYNLNNGVQAADAIEEYNVDTVTFDLPFPTRENYHFKGWYEQENLSGNPVSNIKRGTMGNKVYYAKWEAYKDYTGYDVYEVLKDEATSDAVKSVFVPNDDGIDFSKGGGISNGSGKYVMDSTKNDQYPIYYYRGEVEDNNVLFGGFCWLIVRTTNTGGTKLIYNGVAEDGKCLKTGTDTFTSSKIRFNNPYSKTEATGYTYVGSHTQTAATLSSISVGTVLGNDVVYEDDHYVLQNTYTVDENFQGDIDAITSTHHYTCASTSNECTSVRYIFMGRDPQYYYITLTLGEKIEDVIEYRAFDPQNSTNSIIKTNIDTWYQNNLTEKTNMLEDTIWCNDRSIYTKGGWDKNTSIYEKVMFGPTARVSILFEPSVSCTNYNDRYTVSSENGNGALDYPIGLLTADETVLAGYAWFEDSTASYLNNGHLWWTMSPSLLSANYAYIDVAYSILDNVHAGYNTTSSITTGGVRPSISLKSGTIILSGNGTKTNPYTVE